MAGTLREETLQRLAAAGLAPQHRLGQNFMVDADALGSMLAAAAEAPERVLEIGPGTGLLSDRILAAGHQLLAVELDHGLAGLLRERYADRPAFRLVEGDALASKNAVHPEIAAWAEQGPWALVANLPYDISIPLVLNLLQLPQPPQLMVATLQYEAAARLCATPGAASWGASAAVGAAAGESRILRKLPPRCFHPRPRVQSAIWQLRPERSVPATFGRFCRRIFAYRRKVLPRALRDCGCERPAVNTWMEAHPALQGRRVEQLAVADLLILHEEFPCVSVL